MRFFDEREINLLTNYGGGYSYRDIVQEVFMKRTIIAVISIVLIAFAFTACRQSVVIPFDPMPGNPNTPSGPSVPDYTIQVGDKTYQHLDEAIAAAPENGTINIGKGRFIIPSTLTLSKNLTINGAGMDDKTIITVNGNTAFNITGSSVTISNLTIQDTAAPSERRLINVESSKIEIDSVRFEGLYTYGEIKYYGIVTNADVSDVTIKNSVFKGFKIPVLLDFDNVENPKATISGNTFDTFNKLSFSNYNGSIIISSDNKFVNPTNKEYQIELFKGDSLTAKQAVSVAKNTGLVVKAELEEEVYYNFDAEGAVISTVDQLEAFATGNAGSKARLTEGTFQLDSTISMTSDISIVGAGKDETILEVNGFGAFDVSGSNASISNLTISDKANVETSTKRRLIDVHSSKIVIDNVKLKGQYSTAVSGTPPQDHGIVTDKKVSDVTITNSDFIGIRMPILLDFDDVPTYTATVTGNTFDTFEKLSFSNFNESSMSISDNKFGTSTKNFQIELFGTGATSEAAMNIAKVNNCIVQLGVNDTNYNGDGEVTN